MTQAKKEQEKKPTSAKAEPIKEAKTAETKKAAKAEQPKQVKVSQAEIDKLTKDANDWQDKFLRGQAELQNAQKRYSKERAQLIKYQSQDLAKDVLPAVDNLERALAVQADDDASKQLKKGVQMTLDLLVKSLADHGITEIKADGETFDPTVHQAVQTVAAENDDQKDKVVQVLQKGYQYKDRTLRPAMVVVAQ
ncbi:MAG: nucleotide exchange factor GrpE [Lactobacillus sp.]|jgi:molecular chaperone GrpE|nr:nucleotide exchange factor GrpE [Lactobacillus sp.]MCH3906174.1 nucleotide exchange factor GrpE [Lactobacillus sp.]MCH3990249.1 nucleotide exchange factor GrpE [Lactobacillus sp.]MCH4069037.1 nucleotide exchange factor GrpE [Lactobacillus sp.]MCI1303439.1 nucleotide exchange factor GrpE [Lactobacillus sp.]